MSVVAAIRKMLESGLSIEQALLAAEAFEQPILKDRSAAALRQERYRNRLKASQTVTEAITTVTNDASDVTSVTPPSPSPAPFSDKEIPPTPPKENNLFPLPPSTPHVSGEREQALFDRFWAAFPNKVGKADARKAFSKALTRTSVEVMAAGLHRYAAKTDDRPWCNPATWLNQDRWSDAPAQAPPRSPPRNESVLDRRSRELRERIKNEHGIGGEGNGSAEPFGGVLRLADHRRDG